MGLTRIDPIDIALLRSLILDAHSYPTRSEVREPVSHIARKLHVSKQTVRNHIDEYVRSGFLKGWHVLVNPNVIGQAQVQVRLDVLPPSSKRDVINKIKLIDGVWYIINSHGNSLGIGLSYDDEASLRSRVQLMTRIANSEHVVYGQILFPPCSYRFTPADFAIIKAVQGEAPWQSYASIAGHSHLSARTVKRRLDIMMRATALFITPELDIRRLSGAIYADFHVFYVKKEVARETEGKVLSVVSEKFMAVVRGPEHSWFGLMLDNITEGNDILTRVKEFEGVREAYLDLAEEHLAQYEVFNNQIEKLAKEGETGGSLGKSQAHLTRVRHISLPEGLIHHKAPILK